MEFVTYRTGGTRVVVYEERLDAIATRYTVREANQIQSFARVYAPVRSGRLKASIRVDRQKLSGNIKRVSVRASTPYAAAVHEGSGPVIYPHGEFLWVPTTKYGTLRKARPSVRGIMGPSITPFLSRAMKSAVGGSGLGARLFS